MAQFSQLGDDPLLGGLMLAGSGGAEFFGAIVSLSGPTDLPDSIDLTGPDVLGTTLISVPGNPTPRAA